MVEMMNEPGPMAFTCTTLDWHSYETTVSGNIQLSRSQLYVYSGVCVRQMRSSWTRNHEYMYNFSFSQHFSVRVKCETKTKNELKREPFTECMGPSDSLEFHCLIDYNFWLFNSLHIQFMCCIRSWCLCAQSLQLCVSFVVGHCSPLPAFSIRFKRFCFSSLFLSFAPNVCRCGLPTLRTCIVC